MINSLTRQMLTLFIVAAAVLIASGLISMSEAALFTVTPSQIHLALDRKRRGALGLRAIKQNMARPVAGIVILNNAVNIGGSILLGQLSNLYFGSAWIGLFTAVFTLLVILFAEIIPKTLGEKFALNVALYSASVIGVTTRALLPLILFVEAVTLPVRRLKGSRFTAEEEIRALANIGNASGAITSQESELIRRSFQLNDVTAKDIMTHRLKLSYLPAERRLSEIPAEEIQQMHSRILVASGEDLDKIDGVVHQRDLLLAMAEGRTDYKIDALKEPVPFVYEGTTAQHLLIKFLRSRKHLFVVVDEYGGTSGVVSLEDVLEELVGEIEDEMDARESEGRLSPTSFPPKNPAEKGSGPAINPAATSTNEA